MKHLLLPFCILGLCACTPKTHQETDQWRGPGRSGIYPGTNLLHEWPAEGPVLEWTLEGLGDGFIVPVFAGDRFLITGKKDSTAILYCYTVEKEKLWETPLGREWVTSFPGSRSASTIIDDRVYVGTGMGDLYCLDLADGTLVWHKTFGEAYEGQYPFHGHSESPVVWEDRVFWTPGGEHQNVVALDRMTGELIWESPGKGERSAYNPGQLVFTPEHTLFVTFSAYNLLAFDVEDGRLVWIHPQDNTPVDKRQPGNGDTHANGVISDGKTLHYMAGDGNCGVALALEEDGDGIRELWRNREMDGFMGGLLRMGDWLYGSASSSPYLLSVDAHTGTIRDSLRLGSGAIIACDSLLFHYSQRGEMALVSQKDGDLDLLSSFKITGGTGLHFSHPVIHRGRLYLRRGDALFAYSIAGEPA
ncbi:MAG: PQQ-binding-like beta-propeller repeat protein [Bacteroidales bacterium]